VGIISLIPTQKKHPTILIVFALKKILINTEEAPGEKQASLLCNDWQCTNNK
jgi:hypothetical protein